MIIDEARHVHRNFVSKSRGCQILLPVLDLTTFAGFEDNFDYRGTLYLPI